MQHLLPLYLVICILPGVAALTVLSILATRLKIVALTLYLVAYSCFTVSVLVNLVMFYLGINISEEMSAGVFTLISLSIPFSIVMHTTLPLAVNAATRPPGRRWIDLTFIVTAVAELVLFSTPLLMSYSDDTHTLRFGPVFPFVGVVQILLIGYSITVITLRRRSIEDPVVRRYILATTVIIAVFLPAIAYDQFFFRGVDSIATVPVAAILSPSFYAVLSLATLYFGIRYLMSPADSASPAAGQLEAGEPRSLESIVSELAERSALSQRERTIIPLIAEGLGNKQIALELHISTRTVGNHIYNIYRKLDISSRYELLALLK
mgnify:CR=1 FL=1